MPIRGFAQHDSGEYRIHRLRDDERRGTDRFAASARRREVVLMKAVKTVDVHAHCISRRPLRSSTILLKLPDC